MQPNCEGPSLAAKSGHQNLWPSHTIVSKAGVSSSEITQEARETCEDVFVEDVGSCDFWHHHNQSTILDTLEGGFVDNQVIVVDNSNTPIISFKIFLKISTELTQFGHSLVSRPKMGLIHVHLP